MGRAKSFRGWLSAFALGLFFGAMLVGPFVAIAPWVGEPAREQVAEADDADTDERQNQDVNQAVPSTDGFNPWRAPYTEWIMAVLTLAAVGVSYRAVVLLRRTLIETRKANEAAREAVAVTREIGERQTRAYLQFERASINVIFISEESGIERYNVRVEGALVNRGASPATSIHVLMSVSLGPDGKQEQKGPEPHNVAAYIAPDGEALCRLQWSVTLASTLGIGEKYQLPTTMDLRFVWVDVFGETCSYGLKATGEVSGRLFNAAKRGPAVKEDLKWKITMSDTAELPQSRANAAPQTSP